MEKGSQVKKRPSGRTRGGLSNEKLAIASSFDLVEITS
jgi:hypothetical protein